MTQKTPTDRLPNVALRKRLKGARASAEITQEQLGERIGRSRYVVGYWEITGNIPADALGDLCRALDVQMEYWRV